MKEAILDPGAGTSAKINRRNLLEFTSASLCSLCYGKGRPFSGSKGKNGSRPEV